MEELKFEYVFSIKIDQGFVFSQHDLYDVGMYLYRFDFPTVISLFENT